MRDKAKEKRLKEALDEISKLSRDGDRATAIGTLSVLAGLLGVTVASAGIFAPVAVATAATAAAAAAAAGGVSVFKKLRDTQTVTKLLSQDSFTEAEKEFLSAFESRLRSSKTKEEREKIIELFSKQVAQIARS